MYQAAHNVTNGFGSICGASLGGFIADSIGWRWCFLLQVPVSIFALVAGYIVIPCPEKDAKGLDEDVPEFGARLCVIWQQVDLLGSSILVIALSLQLLGLSLGGNVLPWSDVWVIGSLLLSSGLLALFVLVESKTSARPVIPLKMLQWGQPVYIQVANLCVGMAAYAVSTTVEPWLLPVLTTILVSIYDTTIFPSGTDGFR